MENDIVPCVCFRVISGPWGSQPLRWQRELLVSAPFLPVHVYIVHFYVLNNRSFLIISKPILKDIMNESCLAYAVLLSVPSDGQLIHCNQGSVVVSWQLPCGG